jgi:hypothetical protein
MKNQDYNLQVRKCNIYKSKIYTFAIVVIIIIIVTILKMQLFRYLLIEHPCALLLGRHEYLLNE